MGTNYKDYYKAQLEDGKLYQDFVVDACLTLLGLVIQPYSSRAYQMAIGESRTGAEIKHDKKYAKTGNLWIELAEKATQRIGPYVESGINRDDNTWLFIIGDYDTIYIFGKKFLKALADSGRYKLIENKTGTSVGFLLRKADAEKYAIAILTPNASEKVASMTADIETLARELHNILKQDPRQSSLFVEPAKEDKNEFPEELE